MRSIFVIRSLSVELMLPGSPRPRGSEGLYGGSSLISHVRAWDGSLVRFRSFTVDHPSSIVPLMVDPVKLLNRLIPLSLRITIVCREGDF